MNSRKIDSFTEPILAILVSLMGWSIFSVFQVPLQHHLNPLFDANQYQNAYEYFSGTAESYQVNFPFNLRILVPWLAAQLPFEDMASNFMAVNLAFGLLWIPVWFYLAKRLNLGRFKTWIGWFWISFHWVGVLKANLSDPITVDVPIYLFQLLLLVAIWEKRWWLLLCLSPLATLQKESMLPLLLILMVYPGMEWLSKGHKKGFLFLCFAAFISWASLQLVSVHFSAPQENANSIINLLNNFADRIAHPTLFIRWVLALTLAYSAWFWVFVFNYKHQTCHLSDFQKTLLPLSCVYLFFSFLGGGDFTRIAFLGSPFWMLLFLYRLNLNRLQWIILISISLPAMRLFEFIPDGGNDFEKWTTWYPEHAPWTWTGIYLAYTLLLVWVIRRWFWTKRNDALNEQQ